MTIRVFPIEFLLFKLQAKCVGIRNAIYKEKNIPKVEIPCASVLRAKDIMARDQFMYSDIGCNIHMQSDNSANCCLSKVRKLFSTEFELI